MFVEIVVMSLQMFGWMIYILIKLLFLIGLKKCFNKMEKRMEVKDWRETVQNPGAKKKVKPRP